MKENYTVSINYDRRLYKYDIVGSIVHARMLGKQGIIPNSEVETIVSGLEEIRIEIENGNFPWRKDLEDIHMNIENRLFDKIGSTAGLLHTGRSRNDQISLDMRLYIKDVIPQILTSIHTMRLALISQAESHSKVIMPGYTHLQRAQPVLFAHHLLAYYEMFARDRNRYQQTLERSDVLPLGSGALAGVPYPIDREYLARELNFKSITSNSMDAVSDRDFLLDFHSATACCMMHISRLAEELVQWNSFEFEFIHISDEYVTGSSLMPQKRNPDFAELARGKSGRIFGNLVGLLTLLKGLPLTYNRDLQEDKEGFFDSVDTITSTLDVMSDMVSTMSVNQDKMLEATEKGYLLATDLADYLVRKGMPFRQAHGVVGKLSNHAISEGKRFDELTLATYQQFSELFDENVLSINVDSSVNSRNVYGGTSSDQVTQAIARARLDLEAENVT